MPVIIGVTSGGVLVPVQVDANGVVIVDQTSALPAGNNNIGNVDIVTLPALASGTNEIGKIQARSYGYYSGSYQKDPIRFGPSSTVKKTQSDTSLSAGNNTIDLAAVSAGEYQVITNLAFRYVGTPPTFVRVGFYSGATNYTLYDQAAPVSNTTYDKQGWWVFAEDDYIRFYIAGATLNDDFHCYALGFRVDIDQ